MLDFVKIVSQWARDAFQIKNVVPHISGLGKLALNILLNAGILAKLHNILLAQKDNVAIMKLLSLTMSVNNLSLTADSME